MRLTLDLGDHNTLLKLVDRYATKLIDRYATKLIVMVTLSAPPLNLAKKVG